MKTNKNQKTECPLKSRRTCRSRLPRPVPSPRGVPRPLLFPPSDVRYLDLLPAAVRNSRSSSPRRARPGRARVSAQRAASPTRPRLAGAGGRQWAPAARGRRGPRPTRTRCAGFRDSPAEGVAASQLRPALVLLHSFWPCGGPAGWRRKSGAAD